METRRHYDSNKIKKALERTMDQTRITRQKFSPPRKMSVGTSVNAYFYHSAVTSVNETLP